MSAALLVVDLQRGVATDAPGRDRVVERVGSLVEGARQAGAPVVWVQHSDDDLPTGGGGGWSPMIRGRAHRCCRTTRFGPW